jgi:hypothetical protein
LNQSQANRGAYESRANDSNVRKKHFQPRLLGYICAERLSAMEVDMGDLFLFALNLNMSHHSYRPLEGAWNIDFNGADKRGIFKAKLSYRSGRK